jgi:hypothetical protein
MGGQRLVQGKQTALDGSQHEGGDEYLGQAVDGNQPPIGVCVLAQNARLIQKRGRYPCALGEVRSSDLGNQLGVY